MEEKTNLEIKFLKEKRIRREIKTNLEIQSSKSLDKNNFNLDGVKTHFTHSKDKKVDFSINSYFQTPKKFFIQYRMWSKIEEKSVNLMNPNISQIRIDENICNNSNM